MAGPQVVVVDPTSAVGREMVQVLLEGDLLRVGSLRLLAVGESVGEEVESEMGPLTVEELTEAALAGAQVVLFPPGREVAERFVPAARRAGAKVVDTSSFSRGDPSVLLVSPYVNEEALEDGAQVVALPTAAAAQLAAVLLPLAAKAGIVRVHLVSLEAVSGAGLRGVQLLSQQTVNLLNAREGEPGILPQRTAFNVVPQVGRFEGAETSAERSTAAEVRRLLDEPLGELAITALTVPVFYGHTQVVTVATARPLSVAAAREALSGVAQLLDDPAAGVMPGPALAVGDDALHVGRVREGPLGISLVSVADNVRWGTAVPAVKLAARLTGD